MAVADMAGRVAALSMLFALIIASACPLAVHSLGDSDNQSEGPRAAITDFEVSSIEFTSTGKQLPTWEQPDGSFSEYIVRHQSLTIDVTITQIGIGAQGQYADYYVNVTHPVGIILAEFTSNATLTGGEAQEQSFTYVPNYSHSVLSEQGELSGGLGLRQWPYR